MESTRRSRCRHAAAGSAGGLLEDSLRPRLNEGTPFGLAGAAVNTSTLPIRAFPRQPASGVPWLSRGAQPGFAGKPPAAGPTRRHARGGVHTTTRTRTRHRIAGATRCREWNRRAGRVAVTPRLTPPPWACSKTRRAARLRLVRPVGRGGRRRARVPSPASGAPCVAVVRRPALRASPRRRTRRGDRDTHPTSLRRPGATPRMAST
jgi:hypothetical protein